MANLNGEEGSGMMEFASQEMDGNCSSTSIGKFEVDTKDRSVEECEINGSLIIVL